MTKTTPHRIRVLSMVAPLALLLGLATCRAVPRSAQSGSTRQTVVEPNIAPDAWESRPLSVSPLSARGMAFAAWTGTEMLVVGGYADPCPPQAECWGVGVGDPLPEAAAYDPAADRWRTIVQPGESVGPSVTIDGRVYARTPSDGLLSYDSDEDIWKAESPGFPLPGRWAHMIAAGDEILFLTSGQDDHKPATLVGWTPSTGAVRHLPPPPLPDMFDIRILWTRGMIVLLGAELVPNPNSVKPSLLIGATYEPGVGWQRLPPSTFMTNGDPWLAVEDLLVCPDGLVADGSFIRNFGRDHGRFYTLGGKLDVEGRTWLPLRNRPPVTPGPSVVPDMVVGGNVVSGDGFLFDPHADNWRPIPQSVRDVLGRDNAAVVWTGSEVLVWGGGHRSGDDYVVHDDGVALRPPLRQP